MQTFAFCRRENFSFRFHSPLPVHSFLNHSDIPTGMEQRHEPIVTGPDRLLRLVNESHELTLTDAANALKVDGPVVDEWSDMLEEAGLIMTRYTLKEKYLFCKETAAPQKRRNFLLRHAMAFAKGPQLHNEHNLKEQQKNIDKALRHLDE